MKSGFIVGVIAVSSVLVTASAFAEDMEAEERNCYRKWRISVGGAFNSRVRTSLSLRDMPVPAAYTVPYSSTKEHALSEARARRFDGGGYIASDENDNGYSTTNWKLPVGAYRGDGQFELNNAYEEVLGSSFAAEQRDRSDDPRQFGISAEIARELWIHDEHEKHRWGVDFAAAFSYFFQRDVYETSGSVTRFDRVKDGVIRTDVDDPDCMYQYDNNEDSSVGGMYGYGSYAHNENAPALGLSGLNFRGNPYIGDPYDLPGVGSHTVGSSCEYRATGDYRELEMLFMLRPWYEITDWWRIYAQGGLAVSWGRFDTSFFGNGVREDEDFAQWDCYGVAGLGTSLRYDRLTLAVDVLGRFLRDDLEVDGRYVNGSIDRSDWCVRVMIGYEF